MSTPIVEHALSLAGRRALITGGTLGIGRAVALLLVRRGASVAIHHSSAVDVAMGYPDAAAKLEQELAADGPGAARVDIDLSEPGAGKRVIAGRE